MTTLELPQPINDWFAAKGWQPRRHQLEMLAAARAGRSVLLVAPTGAGKTLAGFLPSLVELIEAMEGAETVRPEPVEGLSSPSAASEKSKGLRPAQPERVGDGLHTLYISPLKALAVDVQR